MPALVASQSAGVFWTPDLDLVTVEDWGEEIFSEGVDVKWEKWARGGGARPPPQLASAPILYRSSIQDGGIENLIYYLAFRSKITQALQATVQDLAHLACSQS